MNIEVNSERWIMLDNLPNEVWKDIPGFEEQYKISNYARIKSILGKPKILTIKTSGKYYHIRLYKNKRPVNFAIHRILAKTFIPNPNNYPCVNHKDENPHNNNVNNLEWCTYKYNNNYGSRIQRAIKSQQIKIKQYDLCGNYIKTWNGINEAIRYYNNKHIWEVCIGKRKTASGFKWKYSEE